MHDDLRFVRQSCDRLVSERLEPATYRRRTPMRIEAWTAPGEPVPFGEAVAQDYAPFEVGTPWGAPWSTTWFRLTGTVPADATSGGPLELVVDLGFTGSGPGFQAEGTAYDADGRIIKAVEPRNCHVPVRVGPGETVQVYLEAAANPDVQDRFRPTPLGRRSTAGDRPLYVFGQADVAERDLEVWELVQDIETLLGLVDTLGADQPRRAEVLVAIQRMLDVIDPTDVSATAGAARAELREVLAAPAHSSAHRIIATGHAHIDSAWLWPVRETVRKCARTFSNVVALMDAHPDVTFACSSAQQLAWVQQFYPELFGRIQQLVDEGRFVPVGGMWVESDTNLPGGEAMARQFVAGKRFFIEQLGVDPLEVWLPDSFGYSAALPQIARAAGCRWFLTQKISWNDTNAMPHHTFLWEGIDGTRVFTHFPPVDTYNSDLSGPELDRAQRQYREKGRANTSLVPFGYGDGGGGPTREMVAAARRSADLEGSPRVTIGTPRQFFETAEAEYVAPPVWSGELYLEFHRGTYTSQARTKQGNRRSEHLLREAELWCSTAAVRTGFDYPYAELERIWRLVLLQQFHDILPGSSIAWVYEDAERTYAEVAASLERIISTAIATLAPKSGAAPVWFNAAPYAVDGVAPLSAGVATVAEGVGVARHGTSVRLDNGVLRVTVDERGLLTSVYDLAADREVIPAGSAANLLQLHRDVPAQWDAWDLDRAYRRTVTDLDTADAVDLLDDGVRVTRSFGASTLVQTVRLRPGEPALDIETDVDWHEQQKLLKLAFPLDVHADRAASETQFGHVHRPTHDNTSWDAARFETPAHRWVHVGEPGYGVAVANDATYGHDIGRTTRPDGGTTTTVRLSLLRGPRFPDPDADQGRHVLHVTLRVGAGVAEAVREGYRINLPLRAAPGGVVEPLVTVDHPGVVVEAVKLAEDRSGDVVVRLYEAHGNRATTRLTTSFPVARVTATDLLERDLADAEPLEVVGSGVHVAVRPFQLRTLRFRRA